jgi:basic membrane protein A
MFKKILCSALALLMCVSCVAILSACADDGVFKVGFICLHDENSTYDKNFIEGALAACEAAGLTDEQVIFKKQIPESNDCYVAAKDLVDQGCDVIFANSFGHEDYIIQAAKEFPDVQFCHATGTKAHTENIPNYQNAFASIYEGRYLAGIAAGMKLNEMIANEEITAEEAVMGYVGAYTYAEVMSGYTSFYLGAKSVCPSVTMKVTFTGSWYDEAKERAAAEMLINEKNCVLISQHADSMGAPTACETAGVPNVSYNGSTLSACPNTFIVSSRINWEPYFTYMIEKAQKGEDIMTDYTGTLETGSVVLTDVNTAVAAEGTADAIAAAKAKLISGELKVFDVAKDNFITVNGEKLTTYKADVNSDAAFEKDTEVIANGVFEESKHRSAPYFDIEIDGIELLDRNYG